MRALEEEKGVMCIKFIVQSIGFIRRRGNNSSTQRNAEIH